MNHIHEIHSYVTNTPLWKGKRKNPMIKINSEAWRKK